MKRMIYQVKVGNNTPPYYDVCIASVKRYCQRYNIDHIVQTEPILKIRPLKSQRSEEAVNRLGYLPIYEKENAFNYLRDYQQIAIVDSDVYIVDTSPNVFDNFDDSMDAVFAGVIEQSMPNTDQYNNKIRKYSEGQYGKLAKKVKWPQSTAFGYDFFNMGVMVFTDGIEAYLGGQTPEQFIRRREFEGFVNGEGNWRWSTDQTLLNYWIRKSNMPVKNLDWRWNTLFKGVRDEYLSEAYFIHFFLSNNLPQKGREIPSIVKDLSLAHEIKYGHK